MIGCVSAAHRKEHPAMSMRPDSENAIADSDRVILALEQRSDLPFAATLLAHHRAMRAELEQCDATGRAAVEAWRVALASRWDCEVAGRRLYKQSLRQLIDHFGEQAPQVQLLSRAGAEVNSSPQELHDDLMRLVAVLQLEVGSLAFASERLAQIRASAVALERAIDGARRTEHERRTAVLDMRMAREAFRRACDETFARLTEHFGSPLPDEFERALLSEQI
jgi:hypothetical protein